MRNNADVIVIGAGPAGIGASLGLHELGVDVCLLEATGEAGGKLNQWHHLFPSRMEAGKLKEDMIKQLIDNNINLQTQQQVISIKQEHDHWQVDTSRARWQARAVLLAGGFDVFDAHLKEEYGYGIYGNVITSVELEAMFGEDRLLTREGRRPDRVAFVHCVGSRDTKVGNHHCSRACCITGVKQAIEVREKIPGCEVYNFYMDMRMFGSGYEELYQQAQEQYNVTFIRGRVSEASENKEGRIVIKAEDTLSGRPLKMTVDILVLLLGMVPAALVQKMAIPADLKLSTDGFLEGVDGFTGMNRSPLSGLFLAGTCTGPKSIPEAMSDGRSAALEVASWLKSHTNVKA